jgi:tetratricopeptide (TPR) repeat protein
MTTKTNLLILCSLFLLAPAPRLSAGDEELGQAAEKAGKNREALARYAAAFQNASSGTDTERRLREKILKLAPKVKPPLEMPEPAERAMARGEAALEMAKSEADFKEAAGEFEQALRYAPWWGRGYGQLAGVQEKAGDYGGAIRNLKLYRLAVTTPAEVKEIQQRIYKLEYKQEHARKTEEAEQRLAAQKEEARLDLSGFWVELPGLTATYQVVMSGNHFEIFRVSVCPQGNCNDQRSVHERLYTGTVNGGAISGEREEPAALDHIEMIGGLNQSCPVPAGKYPMTGALSRDGTVLTLHVVRASGNRACPSTESHLRLQREK